MYNDFNEGKNEWEDEVDKNELNFLTKDISSCRQILNELYTLLINTPQNILKEKIRKHFKHFLKLHHKYDSEYSILINRLIHEKGYAPSLVIRTVNPKIPNFIFDYLNIEHLIN